MLTVGRILATISEVVAPLIIVRLLGKGDVGVLTTLLLIYTTLSMVLTLGLPGTLSFHLPTHTREVRRAIARRMGLLMIGLGVLAALIQLGIAGLSWAGVLRLDVQLHHLAFLIGLPLGDIPMRMLPNLLVVEGYERAAASTSVIRSIGMSLGTLVPLALGADVTTVMLVLSGIGLGFGAITYGYYRLVYRGAALGETELTIPDLVRFAIPIGLTELVANLNNRLDRFLILPLGAIAYAEYNAGSWQIPLIPSLSYAVGVAYGPHFAALFKEGKLREVVDVWRAQAAKTALIVVPISLVFVVAAEETITLLFTADYLNGASVLRLYALMTMGRITAFGTILVAAGKPRYVFHAASITFASNVAISVPLALWLGFNGPALGNLLAFIPMVCAYTWYIGRVTDVPFRQVFPLAAWLKVVATAMPGTLAAVAFKLYTDLSPLASFGIEAAIVLGGFALAGSATGLITREEWRFLSRYLFLKIPGRSTPVSPTPHG